MTPPPPPILSYAFRPFFLLGGGFAIVAMLAWLGALHALPVALGGDPLLWHAHEMLFGFGGAAIAGFLLTAVATWTGRPPVAGGALVLLAAAWLAGRLAMLVPAGLPDPAIAAIELAFPLLLAGFAVREIVAGGSRRNFPVAGVVVLLFVLDLGFHLGRAGAWPGADRVALYLAIHLLLVLITVIAGRIVPAFTGNWLRQGGDTRLPSSRPWLEAALIPLAVATGLAHSLAAPPFVAGALALLLGLLHALRLAGWRGLATTREPLVLVLHVAYAWLPVGYLLLGLVALGLPLPASAALHALTMGAIGGMILAVATRVALGHTGRRLAASPATGIAYLLLNLAVLVRIASPLAPGLYLSLIDVAASGWLAAFTLFLVVYWPVLTGPRAGGYP